MSERDDKKIPEGKAEQPDAKRRRALKLLGLLPFAAVAGYTAPEIYQTSTAAAEDDGLPPEESNGFDDPKVSSKKKTAKKKARKKVAKRKAKKKAVAKKKAAKKKAKKKVVTKKKTTKITKLPLY
jgi:hypothetical protein